MKATDRVTVVTMTKDGKNIASGSWDEIVGVHTWYTDVQKWKRNVFCGHSTCVTCVTIDTQATCTVSGSWDRTVHVWHEGDGDWQCTAELEHDSMVGRVALYINRSVEYNESGDRDGKVHVWEGKHGNRTKRVIKAYANAVFRVKRTTRGIVWSEKDKTILIAEQDVESCSRTEGKEHSCEVNCAQVAMTGRRVLSGRMDGAVIM